MASGRVNITEPLSWDGSVILPCSYFLSILRMKCAKSSGNDSADLLIAATALEHGLTVVTRNVCHFEPTGVPVLDPS